MGVEVEEDTVPKVTFGIWFEVRLGAGVTPGDGDDKGVGAGGESVAVGARLDLGVARDTNGAADG